MDNLENNVENSVEKKSSSKSYVIIIVVLLLIVLGLTSFIFYDKVFLKNENTNIEVTNIEVNNKVNDNSNTIDTNTKTDNNQTIVDSIKITNLTFDKPKAGGIGGTTFTLSTNMDVDLKCTNNSVLGVQIFGYCLDNDENKYQFNGPSGGDAWYCDNNQEDKWTVEANKLIKKDGTVYTINPSGETRDINWENIEINYCKFDEARLVLKDGSIVDNKISIKYEKYFE